MFHKGSALFFVMPGVPYEMKRMVTDTVLPSIEQNIPERSVLHRTVRTTGIAESHLAELLGDAVDLLSHEAGLSLAYLPSPQGVRIRISGTGPDAERLRRAVKMTEEKILSKAAKYVYGFDEDDLETVVGKILTERRLRIALAESCTGGLLTDRLTNVPGSSAYLDRGLICYSNVSKQEELGIARAIIETHGAVSSEVAVAMAEGVRRSSESDIGLSTTGIAGPSGGSESKPVGLVYIGYSDADGSLAVSSVFGNDRRRVKERSTQAALEFLRRKLLSV
jgi:nicotinamide-nucleotide amidase